MLAALDSALNYVTNSFLPWMQRDEAKSFCSLQFLAFATAIFALYWLLPGKRARVCLLVAASFYFYASWNRRLALLVTRYDRAGLPPRPRHGRRSTAGLRASCSSASA